MGWYRLMLWGFWFGYWKDLWRACFSQKRSTPYHHYNNSVNGKSKTCNDFLSRLHSLLEMNEKENWMHFITENCMVICRFNFQKKYFIRIFHKLFNLIIHAKFHFAIIVFYIIFLFTKNTYNVFVLLQNGKIVTI